MRGQHRGGNRRGAETQGPVVRAVIETGRTMLSAALATFLLSYAHTYIEMLIAGLGVGPFYPLILSYLLRALPLPLAVF